MSHRPGPVCGNHECPCATPGYVCGEFLPDYSPYCIRCGWEQEDHQKRKKLIHKGGKP